MMRLTRKFSKEGVSKLATQPLVFREFSGMPLVAGELHIETVKLMNYNILADSLVARRLYIKDELAYVPIDLRIDKIISEVDTLKPDLLLLQEKQKGENKSVDMLKQRNYEVK